MCSQQPLYRGKAKDMHSGKEQHQLVMHFRDDVTAYNGIKSDKLAGKGEINCAINTFIMQYLHKNGIDSHFIRQLSVNESLVHKADVLPIESIFRNRVAGSFSRKYAIEQGTKLRHPVIEFCLKSDELNDPLIDDTAISALGLAKTQEIDEIRHLTTKVNQLLGDMFLQCGYELIDGKLEFGRLAHNGKLVLVDEITPDSCRLWNAKGEHFDKDLFREDLGDLVAGYQKVYASLYSGIR